MSTIFTLALDPADTNAADSGSSTEVINTFVDLFASILSAPSDTDSQLEIFESYFNVSNASSTTIIPDEIVTTSGKNIEQLDMDGNTLFSSSTPTFSITKAETINMLGSVEKINEDEFLVADSINKRAIILNRSGVIKWEYSSDRYVLDAHYISDNHNIIINSDYVNTTNIIPINKRQKIIWTNNLSNSITLYAGITDPEDYEYFDIDSYPNLLEIEIESGKSFIYNFQVQGYIWWFTYPSFTYQGKFIISDSKFSPNDHFLIIESDSLDSIFTSRAIKVDIWGNIIWSFGNKYISRPKDIRSQLNDIIIST